MPSLLTPIRSSRVYSVLVLFMLAGVAAAEDTGNSVKNIEFAVVNGHSLKLDLYLPRQRGGPLVVWIHGGGWRGGSKDRCPVTWLTDHGYAVASIAYRLTDKATFPAQIHDCKGAVRWLRAHADEYGYSVERVAVAGSSAGGHLAALLGTSGGVPELEGDVGGNGEQSSRVDAVVDYFGPTDFILRSQNQPSRANVEGSPVNLLLGGGADQQVELARLASPVTHVTADDPPFLVLHGDRDKTVFLDQSQRIQAEFEQRELPLTLHVLAGAGHGGKEFFEGRPRALVIEFLDRRLKKD